MRRVLALVALACASAILLAVLIPFAIVIRGIAEDRAVAGAREQATALVAVLAGSNDRAVISRNIAEMTEYTDHDLGVHLPSQSPLRATRLRPDQLSSSTTVPAHDGLVLVQPVQLADGSRATVEVYVAHELVTEQVTRVWAILAATTVAMLAGAVLLVDRLAIKLVRDITRLARASRALGGGDLTERIDPRGPPELVNAAIAFNVMAEQITGLLAAERELAADLSHRLRTPLTALRLDADRRPPPRASSAPPRWTRCTTARKPSTTKNSSPKAQETSYPVSSAHSR